MVSELLLTRDLDTDNKITVIFIIINAWMRDSRNLPPKFRWRKKWRLACIKLQPDPANCTAAYHRPEIERPARLPARQVGVLSSCMLACLLACVGQIGSATWRYIGSYRKPPHPLSSFFFLSLFPLCSVPETQPVKKQNAKPGRVHSRNLFLQYFFFRPLNFMVGLVKSNSAPGPRLIVILHLGMLMSSGRIWKREHGTIWPCSVSYKSKR